MPIAASRGHSGGVVLTGTYVATSIGGGTTMAKTVGKEQPDFAPGTSLATVAYRTTWAAVSHGSDPPNEPILLVDNDPSECEAVARSLRNSNDVQVAQSFAEARREAATRSWRGFVLVFELNDGSALDLLDELRADGNQVPALIIAAECRAEVVNRAFRLGASFLCKPFDDVHLSRFAHLLRRSTEVRPDVTDVLRSLRRQHRLTPREFDVLAAVVGGTTRQAFVESRGISNNTYKSQVRSALRKLRASTLGDVRDAVLRSVLGDLTLRG
jgi:DNA-binding NarL/FixJ family response regulator